MRKSHRTPADEQVVEPSLAARVRAGRADRWTIGVLVPMLNTGFFDGVLTGVVETAWHADCRVVAVQTTEAGQRSEALESAPEHHKVAWDRVDAFVIVVGAVSEGYVRALDRAGKPVILVASDPVPGVACPVVAADNRGGITAAVEHLLGHGHRRIGYVGRDLMQSDDIVRLDAYREAMRANGLEPTEPVIIPWLDDGSSPELARGLLARNPMPTAVVCSTDANALSLVRALAAAGVEVPGQLAVVGFDGSAEAATNRPPLATVAQSFAALGSTAAARAIDLLDGVAVEPGLHAVPVHLVRRESCGCATAGATTAAAAGVAAPVPAESELDAAGQLPVDLAAVCGGGDPDPHLMAEVADVAARTVELFASADAGAALGDVAAALSGLLREQRDVPQLLTVLRRFARTFAAEAGGDGPAGDRGLATRLDDLLHELTAAVVAQRLAAQPGTHLEFRRIVGHSRITLDLLRRNCRGSRSLEWLSGMQIKAGCLAVWGNDRHTDRGTGAGPAVGADHDALRVVGAYHRAGGETTFGDRYPVREFPPPALLDLVDDQPGSVLYLVPVRFDGSDRGYLALVGPLGAGHDAMIEMLNHWAVMLTVALDQEQSVEEIRAIGERYALAADAANAGLWDLDLTTGASYCSTRWWTLLGTGTGTGTGGSPMTVEALLDRAHPDDRAGLRRLLTGETGPGTGAAELEHRIATGDGGCRWVLTRVRAVTGARGELTRLVCSMTDITDRKVLEERLRHDARFDTLTGLPNRSLFIERLGQAIAASALPDGCGYAVVFLDLDGFKIINDSLGHEVGDQVLVEVARRLKAQMRVVDTVARFGGDEFVVLLAGLATAADVTPVVRRVLDALAEPMVVGEHKVVVSAAAGTALSRTGYADAADVLRDADTAMYRAKARGHGENQVFDTSMHTGAVARLELETDLRQALAAGQFELHFQPVFDLVARVPVGVEALLRWNHPERGPLLPRDFLAVAEATGLILPIGRWTIEAACRWLARWRRALPGLTCTVSVNLANRQFWDPGLLSTARAAVADSGLPASALVLELTEGVLADRPDAAADVLGRLRADGFALHLDDFGTGYSSLAALHSLPLDALKIDRSFVAGVAADERNREMARIMVAMGTALGVAVIAEGVETPEQAAVLAQIGCRLVQGYLCSPPVPAEQVLRLLTAGRPALGQPAPGLPGVGLPGVGPPAAGWSAVGLPAGDRTVGKEKGSAPSGRR